MTKKGLALGIYGYICYNSFAVVARWEENELSLLFKESVSEHFSDFTC